MREHIRKLIDEAWRPADPTGLEDHQEPALRLAAESIRLARLAAGTHMVLSARLIAEAGDPTHEHQAGPALAAGGAPS